MCGHCIYMFEDLKKKKTKKKKTLFIFVNNVAFFSMLYHGAVEYVANTWICVYMIVK